MRSTTILIGLFLMACLNLHAQVGINIDGTPPNSSAMLDVKSSNRGLLPPRMTHAEIDAIVNPANGLIVYCTDCGANGNGAFYGYINGVWNTLLYCLAPVKPTAGPLTPTASQITWNWTAVSGASGYKWGTTANFVTALDMGTATTKTETGLLCNTAYERFVWAYNTCGTSAPLSLAASTTNNPAVSITITASANPVCAGISVTFTATPVNGGTTPAYQWKKNGTNISGATNATYAYIPVTGDALACSLTSSTPCSPGNPATSNTVTMTVNPTLPVSVTIAASANPVCAGTSVTFTATPVNGGTAPAYQWKKNGTAITGATNVTYAYTPVNADALTCVLTNNATCATGSPATSNAVTMTVNVVPAAPTAGTHTPSQTQVVWNWTAVSGATGYKWNTTNNYGTASDMGTANTKTETGLTCNTTFTRYVWAYNACGNSSVTTLTQTTSSCSAVTCSGVPTVVYGGQTYNTLQIGTQCWLRENLNIGTKINGSVTQTNNSIIEKYCYNNDDANCAIYGGLYEWDELMNYTTASLANPSGRQGICPTGWHLPSDAEFCQMETFLDATVNCSFAGQTGTDIGSKLKEAGTAYWASPNTGATNASGFTALGGGYRDYTKVFGGFGTYVGFWTTTEYTPYPSFAWHRTLSNTTANIYQHGTNRPNAFSARCIKDCNNPAIPAFGTHTPSQNQIIWNWTAVSGATGYKWNTTNNYANATDMGTATTKTETGLTCNTAYTRYVWAYNACGYSSTTTLTSTTSACLAFTCGTVLTDTRDAKTYNTVMIGTQCWMGQNLNIGTRINGVVNPSNNGTIEKYCYGDNEANCTTYGGLYLWNELMNYTTSSNTNPSGKQGICPSGWHIPADAEWCQMETLLDATTNCSIIGWIGTDLAGKLKEAGTTHWASPNTGATNSSGFLGLPGGVRQSTGVMNTFTYGGYFWSATESSSTNGLYRSLSYNDSRGDRENTGKSTGFSVRCVLDCQVPPSSASGIHTPSQTQIIWNWTTVSGATGYKWNTTNNFATANDMGTAITKTETGLTCNTAYTRYVWAYNVCGNSAAVTLTSTTSACAFTCGTSSLSINHLVTGGVAPVNKTTTYGTVTNIPGELTKCWITSNLGSDHQASSLSDATEASAGWYWQFNKKQGYKHDGTTRTPNTTWITAITENSDWTLVNDPCNLELGTNWHTPTYTEWYNVKTTGAWVNPNGPWNSGLKIHDAGFIRPDNATMDGRGISGDYWSNTQSTSSDGWEMGFWGSTCYLSGGAKAMGLSIRCVKDNCSLPIAPSSGTHTPSSTQIIWNWTTVSGASGYKWSTTNNYANATDMGTAITKTETGLTCATAYTRYVWAYNTCGNSTATTMSLSTTATGTVSVTIAASTNPVCSGSSVTFTATPVNGGTTPAYQWKNGGTAITGATNATYSYTPANADAITCVLTSNTTCATGSPATSNTITMSVSSNLAVSVSIAASANPVCTGTSVTFTATPVNGGTTPAYQWKKGGTAITGATNATYSYTPANADAITCVLTSNATCATGSPATSNSLTMNVNALQPVSVSIAASANPVCSGASVTFTATPVNGGTTPAYQWKKGGTAITGATNATYAYTPVNGDVITCVLASNATCPTGSPATSNTVTMTVNANQAVNVSISASANPVCTGTSVTFTATPVNGGTTPAYQWKKNTTSITGATNATYSYTPANGDVITCVLTSSATCATGSPATSNPVTMSVSSILPVSISIAASANPVCTGTSVTFTATPVNGGTTPTYQWKKGGTAITGATNATYAYTPVNGDVITCVLTSSATCATGSPATSNTVTMAVNVTQVVSVSIAASANPVCTGASVTFTATPANGGTTPAYQWKKGGTAITGATNATYAYTPVNGDVMSCVLTSNATCPTGSPATSNTLTMAVNANQAVSVTIAASSNPVCAGTSVNFTATPVNGGTTPAYQWKKNTAAITGATNATYSYVPANADVITCMLTSSATCPTGSPATSNTLTMAVNATQVVSISIAASANPVCTGASVTFTATPANGGTTPAYQWKKGGTAITGATNAIYSYTPANADVITCVLTSNATCTSGSPATSNTVTIVVSASAAAPVAGTHTPSQSQIIWNWNTVSGATGYKWNTTNDYATATDMGTATTKTETGLICNTSYSRYVWAYTTCGNSTATTLTATTSACSPFTTCGQYFTVNHVAGAVAPVTKTVNYGTVDNIPGELTKCWITRNLGASQQATAANDATEASAGWYWQFNRKQGYKNDGTTLTPSWTITGIDENADWQITNDPCNLELGTAWRVPTNTEWTNINSANNWTNWNAPFSSTLKLHGAGYLDQSNGSSVGRGTIGYYWSGLQSSTTQAPHLAINSTGSYLTNSLKAWGFSVRCLKDVCPVIPYPPTSGTHVPSQTQIIWNWNPVTGATGYKWNTTNDYATATDMGTSTTKTETGLSCSGTFQRYVWSYNACGYHSSAILTQSTLICPSCGDIIVNHVAGTVAPVTKSVTYGTVTSVPGEPTKCWISRNLGASQQATAANDATEASAGWYWQFNRKQGYKHDGSTLTPSWPTTGVDENYDWQITNDPCNLQLGTAWRVPTNTEWTNTNAANGWTNWNGYFNSGLKMHGSGYLDMSNGSSGGRGSIGYFWSGIQSSTTGAPHLGISASSGGMSSSFKSYGFSLRCIKDVCSVIPYPPNPGTHVPSQTQIIWNWNPVSGATGYKWNTTNDYATATDIGTVTTKTETGLLCSNSYQRYLWSYNACGYHSLAILNQSTSLCPGCGDITVNHVAGAVAPVTKTVIYGTLTSLPGEPDKCWITRNLGATQQATAVNDLTEASAGWYWQFNRKQGYKHDGTAVTPSWTVTSINENSDWIPSNDPCNSELGTAWRLPTYTEWSNVKTAGGWTNWNGAWLSGLKLHAAGEIQGGSGSLTSVGSNGNFRSSTQQNNTIGWSMYIYPNNCSMVNWPKVQGMSIRCLKDVCAVNPDPPTPGTHVPSQDQIIWNWNAMPGATGYKWSTSNDYASAIDMGTATSKTETGLLCNNPYTRYVWSYNACGFHMGTYFTLSTLPCPSCGTITVNHVAGAVAPVTKSVTYGTVTGVPGETSKCWIFQNLGSDHQATAVDDATEASAGWYWQFNRKQGYKHDGTTLTPAWTITSISEYSDWLPSNDPCNSELGTAWRLPTYTEWSNVKSAGGWTNWNGPWLSGLKLHAAGQLSNSDGSVSGRGNIGLYWTSLQLNNSEAWLQRVSYDDINFYNVNKARALTLRCLKDACLINPDPPTPGTHVPSQNQIIWNWNPVTGATGYKWNTSNDYASAIDMGTATTKIETGLLCGNSYERYVWSYNSCGFHTFTYFTQSTLPCPTCGTITVNHVAGPVAPVNKSVTYNTVTGVLGEPYKCWIASNLGASQQASAVDDASEVSAGWYWQFNRKQGYKHDGTVVTPSWTVTSINENSDWQIASDPCNTELGSLWRIPTYTEWNNVDNFGGWSTWYGPWSGLKLHAAGRIGNGGLGSRGTHGNYWSSAQDAATSARNIYFFSGYSGMNYFVDGKAAGFPLRCLKDTCSIMLNPPPGSGTQVPSQDQIIWNWTTIQGATGYKWNTTNDYATATDMGTATTKTETGLMCNTAYTRYVWAYNGCGNSSPLSLTQSTSSCGISCPGTSTVSYGGKTYNTVQIGTQCWLRENLDIGVKIDGSVTQTNNSIVEKYCYNNDDANCAVYGGLYQWNEMMNYTASSTANPSGRQGICPSGWHVPSVAEWCQMETLLDATVNCDYCGCWTGADIGGKLKEVGTIHWSAPNSGATNSTGFTGLPGGVAPFVYLPSYGFFWAATEHVPGNARNYQLGNSYSGIAHIIAPNESGRSVRCVKD